MTSLNTPFSTFGLSDIIFYNTSLSVTLSCLNDVTKYTFSNFGLSDIIFNNTSYMCIVSDVQFLNDVTELNVLSYMIYLPETFRT